MLILTDVKKPAPATTAVAAAVAIIFIASIPLAWSKELLGPRECEDLGFTGLALCSDCNTLAEYIKDQELISDCLKCCAEDSDDATSKVTGHIWHGARTLFKDVFARIDPNFDSQVEFGAFQKLGAFIDAYHKPVGHQWRDMIGSFDEQITYSGAVLEVCMRKLVFYPEIVGFIEDEKDQFPTVKVQYIFNSPPKLVLLDDEGQQKESIRIDNWKREHILQFLQEKVKRSSAI